MKFPEFLTHLTKLGYLERTRAATALAGTQPAKKRGRQSQATTAGDDDEDGATIEWKWGSRAHAELGEKAVAVFMVDFMVERAIKLSKGLPLDVIFGPELEDDASEDSAELHALIL